uniref:RRM domain-containing protein n=1 Tax=Davidia involucrata TaxID=16924 RepID=A0A5B6Z8Z6_DAVIN
MAFVNKIGTMLKQTVSKHMKLELSAANPSVYQAIRCMSSSKLFVGGLSYATDDMNLREAFAQYGEVSDAKIIMDRETGRSRGFGFVTYMSSDEASSAIQAMDGKEIQGRIIKVNYATERSRVGGFGPGYGGDRGYGYGGGNASYGGGGDYGSANYGGGGGGYGGGGNSYTGGEGSYSGGGVYGGGNYGSGGGSYGGGNSGGGSGNYGVASGAGGGNNYFGGGSGGDSGFASSGYGGTTGTSYGGDGRQLGGNQDRTDGGNQGFGENMMEGSFRRDDDDEPRDYANTRG